MGFIKNWLFDEDFNSLQRERDTNPDLSKVSSDEKVDYVLSVSPSSDGSNVETSMDIVSQAYNIFDSNREDGSFNIFTVE